MWRCEVWRALAGLGSLGLARSVLERRRGVSFGSHGLLRLVVAGLVKARLGKAVKALRGMSRSSEERLVRARLGKAVGVWHVEASCSMSRRTSEWRVVSRQSCLGSASRVVAWQSRLCGACHGQLWWAWFGWVGQSRQVQMRQGMDWCGRAVTAWETINY